MWRFLNRAVLPVSRISSTFIVVSCLIGSELAIISPMSPGPPYRRRPKVRLRKIKRVIPVYVGVVGRFIFFKLVKYIVNYTVISSWLLR